jgi:hypothetical protein
MKFMGSDRAEYIYIFFLAVNVTGDQTDRENTAAPTLSEFFQKTKYK